MLKRKAHGQQTGRNPEEKEMASAIVVSGRGGRRGGGLEWKGGGGEWSHMPMKEISNCVCRREVVNVPLVSENEPTRQL